MHRTLARFGFLGWLALGIGLGVGGLALSDPRRGAARRTMIRDKLSSRARRIREGTRGLLIHAGDRLRGVIHETKGRFDERGDSHETLEDRRLDVHDEAGGEPSLQGRRQGR